MNSDGILMLVSEAILNGHEDPEDVIKLLEVSLEDIIRKFPSKLIEHAEKFGVYEDTEEDNESRSY